MKTKSKKHNNFKLKYKRKQRTRSARIWWRNGSSAYTKIQRKAYRKKSKTILQKIVHGDDIEFPIPKKTMWWDS